jgi:pimeloyl-ACP methyl ester carboxylesterase
MKEIELGLSRLKIPTLVIWGTGRTAPTYAERVTKMIPTAKLNQVKAGHFVPEDDPDDVEKLVQGFFSENLL